MITVTGVLNEVYAELQCAIKQFPPFNSAHEGFAVLAEEVDELWDAVKMKQSDPTRPQAMRGELIQVAAMAVRMVLDCCKIENCFRCGNVIQPNEDHSKCRGAA